MMHPKTEVKAVTAVVLAAMAISMESARAETWQKTAAGTYTWTGAGNWVAASPNAGGTVANFAVDLTGDQTVNLNQAITIGTLTAGDASGTSALTIASGTGGNPLVFQGATPGATTTINLYAAPAAAASSALTLSSGVRIGGTSPLTASANTAVPWNCSISTLDLNGNTVTLNGTARKTDANLIPIAGALWTVTTLTGSGNYVQNGAGTNITNASPGFTGTLTINDGPFSTGSSLSGVTQYAVGGAFETTGPTVNGQTPGKYPIGGSFTLGAGWPSVATLPDRLNHNGTLVFNGGGYMQYIGQALDSSLTGQALVEQVKQIRFNPGMSELGMDNGNDVSSSTTLLANDATSAMVRQQGATFMIGGDVANAWSGLGGMYKLKFNSGMTSQLKGGGGPAGSQSVSIIPWMTCGTLYHPSQGLFVTYDNTNGVRALTANEYYTGTVYGAPATVNVKASSLHLGAGHTQTINSYVTDPNFWGNTDIGPGSTLTVASGLVSFQGAGSIGDGTPANAGTLNFGTSEGIIWSAWQSYTPNVIGSLITGSGGLTTAGTNAMILKAANTYTGKTVVGAGILQIGDGTLTASRLGVGDVEVTTGATLRIKSNVADGITDTAIVALDNYGASFFGRMELESSINETVGGLWLGGVWQPFGTYGSSSSPATYKSDDYFSGPGVLTVVPEPTSLTLLWLAGLALRRRRS